jgi:site-specific DNA-methyltransferase (adenine-specific)
MNPPYGTAIKHWVRKAYESTEKGATTVALLPARTDTRWFHDYIYHKSNVEIRFICGRVKFVGAKHAAPFPSMIVVFYPK